MNKVKLSIAVRILAICVVAALVLAGSADASLTEDKFRVGPSVQLRPITDVIEANHDGIVELYMDNPALNDVKLTVEV